MQILDVIMPSRLDMIEEGPHFGFEDSPEYKEMVRRATDSLQHIQDSIRNAATDTAQAVGDTIHAAVPMAGSAGGDDTALLPLTLLGSVAALSVCAYLIFNISRSRKACRC
ncbi:MAG: hypothetical protein IKQ68_09670 [Prevotella sp.]|nr:hypothetical protein [Prevotella sp.]